MVPGRKPRRQRPFPNRHRNRWISFARLDALAEAGKEQSDTHGTWRSSARTSRGSGSRRAARLSVTAIIGFKRHASSLDAAANSADWGSGNERGALGDYLRFCDRVKFSATQEASAGGGSDQLIETAAGNVVRKGCAVIASRRVLAPRMEVGNDVPFPTLGGI